MNNDVNHNDSGLAMPPEELFDLLADRATFGLDDDETTRLDQLLRENSWVREECLDETAAVLAAAALQASRRSRCCAHAKSSRR